MKTTDLSIKELAAVFGVSPDTVRRAARKGMIQSTRVGTAYRFDLRKVEAQMQRNGRRSSRKDTAGAPGGESRPRAAQSPPDGNTGTRGHLPQGSLQEVYPLDELPIHTYHRLALFYTPEWKGQGHHGYSRRRVDQEPRHLSGLSIVLDDRGLR